MSRLAPTTLKLGADNELEFDIHNYTQWRRLDLEYAVEWNILKGKDVPPLKENIGKDKIVAFCDYNNIDMKLCEFYEDIHGTPRVKRPPRPEEPKQEENTAPENTAPPATPTPPPANPAQGATPPPPPPAPETETQNEKTENTAENGENNPPPAKDDTQEIKVDENTPYNELQKMASAKNISPVGKSKEQLIGLING